jgi:hypothetical protein
MRHSEITLLEAVDMLEAFAPIKITFNGIVLYNDYDSEIEVEPGVFGEVKPAEAVIPERLWRINDYIVTSMKVTIIEYHHSLIDLRGKLKKEKRND